MLIEQQINLIQSRQDFVNFMRSLLKDLRDNPKSWENDTLERYFEAIAAWTNDMDGYYLNQRKPIPFQLNWRILAEILMAAKIYE